MESANKPNIWEKLADKIINHYRLIIVFSLIITIIFAFGLTKLKNGTYIRNFHQKDSLNLIDTIENDFDQSGYVSVIFVTQNKESLLSPKMMKAQLKVLKEIEKKYKVTIHSLVKGIDEGLKRIKHKSLFDIDSYDDIGEAFLAVAGETTVWDLEKVSQHLLSHPDVTQFYERFRINASFMSMLSPSQNTIVGNTTWLGDTSLGNTMGGNIVSSNTGGGGHSKLRFKTLWMKAILSYVQIDASLSVEQEREVLVGIRKITDKYSTPDLKIYTYDDDLISNDIDVQSQENSAKMGLALMLIIAILLLVIYRNWQEIILTLIVVTLCCIWTFGLTGYLNIPLSFIHIIVLPILLGTGIDDSVVIAKRLFEEWQQQDHNKFQNKNLTKSEQYNRLIKSLKTTYSSVGLGVFLTTFTTFVAFLFGGLVALSEVMLSFYLLVAFAMLAVFSLTFFFQGALRVLLAKRGYIVLASPKSDKDGLARTFLMALPILASKILRKGSLAIIFISILIFSSSLYSGQHVESEFTREMFMRKSMPVYEANEIFNSHFKDADLGFILFEGDVANPDLLIKMKKLRAWMNSYPMFEKILNRAHVVSINDLIDKMRIRLLPNTDAKAIFDKILNNNKTANLVLDETYPESAKKVLRKQNGKYDGLVMKFFVEEPDARLNRQLVKDLKIQMTKLGFDDIPGVKYRIGAGDIGLNLEETYYFANLIKSFFVSLLVNFIILLIIWRRFWHCVLALIPIIFAVFFTLGLLPILSIKLNMVNICVGSIAVGLGIDYPIHLLERYHEEKIRNPGLSTLKIVQIVLKTMGPNIFGASLTTIAGFSTAVILALPVAENFGFMTALTIFMAYFASITLLPAVLIKKPQNAK